MKIERDSPDGRNRFTAYGEGWVEVAGRRLAGNVVVAADRILEGWTAGALDGLTADDTAALLDWRPEVLLLGSGAAFRRPDPDAIAPLHRAGLGVEVMDTRAACRTYNILLGEGRRVVAALIVE
ncbi:MAG: Mth938-like domain-containing protein [Burkholderiales bacterium]